MIGECISHYKILRKLGEGGMGVVYSARDTKLDRDVALKFLPPNPSLSQEDISRFDREAKAISALNHPSIATIFDVDEVDGQRYLVLEYVPGGTVREKLRHLKAQNKQFTISEVLGLGVQITEGLVHAHNRGIIHRDLKSDNILLTEEGHVKIADFGLAKLRGGMQITKSGNMVGTAGYVSPEQIRGEEVDHRTDIFSFGVVLYELLTSQLPFRGEFEAAVTYSILNDAPTPFGSLRSDIPASLDTVLRRCLEKERSVRYERTEDLLADLRKIQIEMGVPAGSRTRKLPLGWIAAGTVGAVGLLAFFLLLPPGDSAQRVESSIAVLPFRNLSDDKEDEFFADGLTEDIITEVSRIRGIGKVIARTSIMQYKGVDRSVRDIGKELDVATVLEGSVRRAGGRVRIVAQLIDVSDEDHLWAETYDRDMTQIFEIQSSVAGEIAAALKVQYSARRSNQPSQGRNENTAAYELYLRGRHFWSKRTDRDLRTAVEYFNQAIDEDPLYAPAYGGLAITYAVMPGYTGIPACETVPLARAAARRALELDSSLAEPHAALGFVGYWYARSWSEGRRELERALELNPNYATAHHWFSHYLSFVGQPDEAVLHMKRTMELDPLSHGGLICLGQIYYDGHRYDEAIASFQKALGFDSTSLDVHGWMARVYVALDLYENAFDHWRKQGEVDVDQWWDAYRKGGSRGLWQTRLALAQKSSGKGPVAPGTMAAIYSHLQMNDLAFEWLDRARNENSVPLSIKVSPEFDNIRSDPRFAVLLKNIGL